MIDTPFINLDLSEHRAIAGYILALLALHKLPRAALLSLSLRNTAEAQWLAALLDRQGYAVMAMEAEGPRARLKIRNKTA